MTIPGNIAIAFIATLAQGGDWEPRRILWAVLGLAVAVVVLAVVALMVRRHLLSQDEPGQAAGFTLADMRRLRDAGDLSEQEYERARTALIGRARQDFPVSPPQETPNAPTDPPADPEGTGGDGPSDKKPDSDKQDRP